MAGQFTMMKTKKNQFMFLLMDEQERVLFTSIPFPELNDAREAISEFKTRAASFPNFERKKTPTNKMYFILRSGSGGILGSSEKHSSIAELENSITAVNKSAAEAQIADESQSTDTLSEPDD